MIIDFAKHFKSVKSFENDGIYTVEVRVPTVKHAESIIYPLREKVSEPLMTMLARDLTEENENLSPQGRMEQAVLKIKDNPNDYNGEEVEEILNETVLFMQDFQRTTFNEVKKIVFSYCKDNFTVVGGNDNDIIKYTKDQMKHIDNIEFGELNEIEEFSREIIASFLGVCVWKPLMQKIKNFKTLNTKRTKKA
jgi:hypothetical protein